MAHYLDEDPDFGFEAQLAEEEDVLHDEEVSLAHEQALQVEELEVTMQEMEALDVPPLPISQVHRPQASSLLHVCHVSALFFFSILSQCRMFAVELWPAAM